MSEPFRFSKRWRSGAIALAVLGGVAGGASFMLAASSAHASTLIALSLEELVTRAERVVVAVPRTRSSRWESGRMVTYTTVDVEATLGGSAATAPLVVRTLGGEIDGLGQQVYGEAKLPLGAPVILFLRAPIAAKDVALLGSLGVVAMEQGAMHINRAAGKIDTVRATLGSEAITPPGSSIVPAHVRVAGRAVADVSNEIRGLFAAKDKK
ncbi:MAG: hypothetical protein ACHREM_13000 [Polyangiales bacterium]